jgi:F0F1-type ATP synthase assembly protein I
MVDFALFRDSTFTGAVFAMIGYGASAQVMVFFLPLFLQNAYGFTPLKAGLAMAPFALPMVVAPRAVSHLAQRYSGRDILTGGLAITAVGNLVFWALARTGQSYPFFVVGMLIAGCGAGVLNGQTVKVLQSAVPAARAGMASGLASTTRFIGILVSVAGLGAILAFKARNSFTREALAIGLKSDLLDDASRRVTSGDLDGMLANVPESMRVALHAAGQGAYAQGFANAALVAAVVAATACALTFIFVRRENTLPTEGANTAPIPCKVVDCRAPL